jgi:hypothetical protein
MVLAAAQARAVEAARAATLERKADHHRLLAMVTRFSMAVRIYQKIPNNMQQGRGNSSGWLLEHDVPYACRADPLTGWQGSGDTRGQVTLTFPTREAAVRFAEREGLEFHVTESPPARRLKIQAYASNFQGPDIP